MTSKMPLVVINKKKRLTRKVTPFYKKKLERLSPGQITRINIYNWRAETTYWPVNYINRVYGGQYIVIEKDQKGFTVLCLRKEERFR